MGEKFDNIQQVFGRVGEAVEKVIEAVEASDDTVITNAGDQELAKLTSSLIEYAIESGKAISALNAMMAVVAAKTDMMWMVDGPGIDMEALANG